MVDAEESADSAKRVGKVSSSVSGAVSVSASESSDGHSSLGQDNGASSSVTFSTSLNN